MSVQSRPAAGVRVKLQGRRKKQLVDVLNEDERDAAEALAGLGRLALLRKGDKTLSLDDQNQGNVARRCLLMQSEEECKLSDVCAWKQGSRICVPGNELMSPRFAGKQSMTMSTAFGLHKLVGVHDVKCGKKSVPLPPEYALKEFEAAGSLRTFLFPWADSEKFPLDGAGFDDRGILKDDTRDVDLAVMASAYAVLVRDLCQDVDRKVLLIGHSLGAALAQAVGLILADDKIAAKITVAGSGCGEVLSLSAIKKFRDAYENRHVFFVKYARGVQRDKLFIDGHVFLKLNASMENEETHLPKTLMINGENYTDFDPKAKYVMHPTDRLHSWAETYRPALELVLQKSTSKQLFL